jgi:hypothetical protein
MQQAVHAGAVRDTERLGQFARFEMLLLDHEILALSRIFALYKSNLPGV